MVKQSEDLTSDTWVAYMEKCFDASKQSQSYIYRLNQLEDAIKKMEREMHHYIEQTHITLKHYKLTDSLCLSLLNANAIPQLRWIFTDCPLNIGKKSHQVYYLQTLQPVAELEQTKKLQIFSLLKRWVNLSGTERILTTFSDIERQRNRMNFQVKASAYIINRIKKQYDCRNLRKAYEECFS